MEDKNVQKLLDMLYGMIDEARGATFSSEKCIINREEALDLLDEVRTKLPAELSKAQDLMKSKEQYVDKANREVKRMLDQAQDEAKRLRDQAQEESRRMLEKAQEDAKTIVSESETIQRAQRRSSEIIHQAEDRSRQLYQVANTYTEDALRRTEEAIQAALDEVRESRVRLRRADAGLPGKAQVRSHQAGFGGLTKFSGVFCAFCWHAFFFYRISAYRPLFSRRYAIFLRRYRTNVSKSAGISWKHLKLDKFPGEYGQKNLLQNPIPCYIIKIHIWRCLFFDSDVGLSGAKTHTGVAPSHDFPTKWCRREGMRT